MNKILKIEFFVTILAFTGLISAVEFPKCATPPNQLTHRIDPYARLMLRQRREEAHQNWVQAVAKQAKNSKSASERLEKSTESPISRILNFDQD